MQFILKVLRFNFPSAGFLMKEAFIPSFQAVKVRFYLTETRVQCIKMELYSYDAGLCMRLKNGKKKLLSHLIFHKYAHFYSIFMLSMILNWPVILKSLR